MRPVKYYHQLGVLAPNVVLAHMVNLDDEEVELVLQTGVKIAHCPTTAGWFGYGLSQVSKFPDDILGSSALQRGLAWAAPISGVAVWKTASYPSDCRRPLNVGPGRPPAGA